jgi:DNA-binding NarL/FixJ family response regulator
MESVSLLILHRNRLFRESLAVALGDAVTRVISVANVSELDTYRHEAPPDIAILDIRLSDCEGLKTASSLRSLYPETKIIVLGVREEESEILACFEQVRAAAYLLENASLEELLNNLRAVMLGEVHCSPRATAFLVSRISKNGAHAASNRADERLNSLTPRESEIVRLIDAGFSNKEIAGRLFIEVQTVKNHVHNILGKLKVHGRREAALFSRGQIPAPQTTAASIRAES